MATPKLIFDKQDGTHYEFLIDGLLTFDEDLEQRSLQMPFPFQTADKNVIANIFGQKRSFKCNLLLMDRSDDYTNGTGSYSTGTAYEQKEYLMDYIFQALGHHEIEDEYGTNFSGRIENLAVNRAGDQPTWYDVSFDFVVGIVPLDGGSLL